MSANRAIVASYKKKRSFVQTGKVPEGRRRSLRVARTAVRLKHTEEANAANERKLVPRVRVAKPTYPVWRHNDWLFVTKLSFGKVIERNHDMAYENLVTSTFESLLKDDDPFGVVMVDSSDGGSYGSFVHTEHHDVTFTITSQVPITRKDARAKSINAKSATRVMAARADACKLHLSYYDTKIDEKDHKHGRCGCRMSESKTVPLVGTYRGVIPDLAKAKTKYKARAAKFEAENPDRKYYLTHFPSCSLKSEHTDDAIASVKRLVDDPVYIASIEFPAWVAGDESSRSVNLGHVWA